MKKIGIVTWFDSYNYGTCLQCFSLNKYLIEKGYDAYVIENHKYYYGVKHPIETLMKLIDKVDKRIHYPNQVVPIREDMRIHIDIRKAKNHEFAYKENKVYKIQSKDDYQRLIDSTSVFISGSDQIWNPKYVTPPMLLSFASKNKKKIAYASSLGVSELPKKTIKMYKKYLERFDHIGVREKTAKKIIEDLIGKSVSNVVDPTFLLDKDFWMEFGRLNMNMIPSEKYIFCYFIGDNTNWQKDVKRYSEKEEVEVITVLSESNLIPEFGKILPDAGIADFISLISNAEYVVTDSFHASALSINLNKKFAIYKRFAEEGLDSQNSRISDILEEFDLQKRIVSEENSIDVCLEREINYLKINEKLTRARIQSEEFLLNAIEDQ